MPKVSNKSLAITVDCPAGSKLREVAIQNNLGIPFGCENGICSTCLIQINTGMENITARTEQEEATLSIRSAAPEQRLACQCQINGDVEFEF